MPDNNKDLLPHLFVEGGITTQEYTSPRSGRNKPVNTPERDRFPHAAKLTGQLNALTEIQQQRIIEQKARGIDAFNGIYLRFESTPDFDLKFASLDVRPSGIELCSVKKSGNTHIATVFVPEGKLPIFLRKIQAYANPEKNTPKGHPANREFVESIEAISEAALQALWTDDEALYPIADTEAWWEIWLRRSEEIDYEGVFKEHAPELGIQVSEETIHFLDRTVMLAKATREQLSQSIRLIGAIAEVRSTKDTSAFFVDLGALDQMQWIEDALVRMAHPPDDSPAVCVLDTGLNNAHPLLAPLAADEDIHTYNPVWGTHDANGHGTNMAGTAAFGDLTALLAGDDPIECSHRIESVKIMAAPGSNPDKHLYGAITRDGIAQPEIDQPDRYRVFCMAVTSLDDRDRGRPSSWSAAIDRITSGAEDGKKRLIVLAAGNTDREQRHEYPHSNLTDAIHDPGQSWNALTVGAFTEKNFIDPGVYPGWESIAPIGDLSPSSCTSLDWGNQAWPIKPDIVLEGGNMAINPDNGQADYVDSLDVLSTGHNFQLGGKLLVSFGDTSAATGIASCMAGKLLSEYPDLWPETIRALLVHSAEWTESMKQRFLPLNSKHLKRNLIRYCGYGVPNEQLLYWSTSNSLTLIAQETMQPFDKTPKGVKNRDINIHQLPWPREALEDLGDIEVEMRVTLSYFIEPSPGERGWAKKFKYQSHGLRFDVKRSLETDEEFNQRINKQARDEEDDFEGVPESGEWFLGDQLRRLGNLHSDIWTGSATELANRGYIGVYPVLGWWRERAALERWGNQARYALVVSIRAPESEIDLYTTIQNEITAVVDV
ncbi:MAG: S8 family peptidase [Sedimenticola sp.]